MKRIVMATAGVVVVCLLATPVATQEWPNAIERYDATTVSMDVGKMVVVQIAVTEWSTDEERKQLIQAFESKGSEGAIEFLKTQGEKGFVKFPSASPYLMHYAYSFEQDGKRIIRMGTDRPITHLERSVEARSLANNVSIVDLRMDPSTGKGEGTMIVGAELGRDENTGQIKIGIRGIQPLRFTSVRQKKIKEKKKE